MKKQLLFWALFIVAESVFSVSNTASAQWYVGYPGAYGGAQTPQSAFATGMGNLVRSEGAYNEQSSQAMINVEKARSIYIDNQQKANSGRLALQRMAQAENAKKHEANKAARIKAQEYQAAHRPPSLNSSQLDPATGQINWPVGLTTKEFEPVRQPLQVAFEKRAATGLTSELASQIVKLTGEMKDLLRGQISTIPLHDYSEARRFLDSMMVAASE